MSTGTEAAAEIKAYLGGKDPKLAAVVRALRTLVRGAVPGVAESVNPWGVPTFETDGPLSFWMVATHHVTFGFVRGTSLPDPKGLLEGTGKNLRHVKLRTPEDVKRPALRQLVLAAARLHRKDPGGTPMKIGGSTRPRRSAGPPTRKPR
jgi:hypothetical protein